MRKPSGLIISSLVASQLSSGFAVSEPAVQDAILVQLAPRRSDVGPTFRQPGQPARSPNVNQQNPRGRLAWRNGHWRHTARNGRLGWWWDVGGVWYFYPDSIDGPPDYVSDITVTDETAPPSPAPAKPRPRVFYYSPGSLTGTGYATIEDCSRARDTAGNVGACVIK